MLFSSSSIYPVEMKKLFLLLICAIGVIFNLRAQSGFTSLIPLDPLPISTNTGEKPQAKVWSYAGKHWAVLPNRSGSHLWRLDGTTWTQVLRLSSRTSSKADCKIVGSSAHILLLQGASSQLVSVEYSEEAGSYQFWSRRPSTVGLNLRFGVETATIDIDGTERMWMAYDGVDEIYVKWSDPPYRFWSSAITIATGVTNDDISSVIAMQGKIGVLWSNQNSQRFGFKIHEDGADPNSWSGDEIPASQSAVSIGNGMSDDHMNMSFSSDGRLYCAVKTSYDGGGYADVVLLVRQPSGSWDNAYEIAPVGTRPIVLLNEDTEKLRVVYTQGNGGGNILYKESSTDNISFGSAFPLIDGVYDNSTSTKDNFTNEVVILASNNSYAVGVLAMDVFQTPPPGVPQLASPSDLTTNVPTAPLFVWDSYGGAEFYRFQLSDSPDFSNLVSDQSFISSSSVSVAGLASATTYYWRVRASNGYGDSNWSSVWSFTTSAAAPDSPLVGHWKMDEGGGSLLIDASQYGNNAPLTGGASWVSGVLGQAARFNGVSQYASVADNASLDITGAITVAGWIKPEAVGTQYLVKKAQQHETNGYELSLAGSGYVFFRFNQFSSGDAYRVNSTTPYPTNGNTWMHVAATYDGQSLRMYINGTLNGSLSLPSSPAIAVNGLPLTIGAEAGGYRGLQGAMDDVRIYNTALSAAEILELGTLPPATAVPLPPVLALPLSGASGVLVEPELAWQSSDGASYYRVQVSRDAGFGNVVFDLNHLNEISISVEELAYSTAYYWRVRASNAGGTSAWSEVRGFTTEDLPVPPPSTPVLSLPQENAQDLPVSMDLVWDFAEGADYYHVQVATDEVFQDIHFDHTELIGTTVPISGLGFSSVYFWRVRAFNGAGEGPWSAVRRFTTMDAPPLPPAMPLQDSPGDGATGIPAETVIRWFAVEGADSYRFQLASDSSFGNVLRDSAGLVGTSVEVSGLASGADYFWRVRASNGYGDSNWSSVWSFTTSAAAPDSPLVGH